MTMFRGGPPDTAIIFQYDSQAQVFGHQLSLCGETNLSKVPCKYSWCIKQNVMNKKRELVIVFAHNPHYGYLQSYSVLRQFSYYFLSLRILDSYHYYWKSFRKISNTSGQRRRFKCIQIFHVQFLIVQLTAYEG